MSFKTKRIQDKYKELIPLVLIALEANIPFDTFNEYHHLPFSSYQDFISLYVKEKKETISKHQELEIIYGLSVFKQKLQERIQKKFLYTSFLFILSFFLTVFFVFKFTPNIQNMNQSFNIKNNNIVLTKAIYSFFIVLFILLFILFLLFMGTLKRVDTRTSFYVLVQNTRFKKYLNNLLSYRFIHIYQEIFDYNLSTQEVIMYLRNQDIMIDIQWLAYQIDERLEKGEDIMNAMDLDYFSPIFKIQFQQGYLKNDLDHHLTIAKKAIEKELLLGIDKLSRFYTFGVYLYVLFLILNYYRYLLAPLKIMEGIL